MEKLLADFNEWEQKVVEDLKEKYEAMTRLEAKVAELKRNEALANKKAFEDFKSSNDFQEAVVTSTSAYLSEGFNFCKRKLAYHHPNLGIDLVAWKWIGTLSSKKRLKLRRRGTMRKGMNRRRARNIPIPSLLEHL